MASFLTTVACYWRFGIRTGTLAGLCLAAASSRAKILRCCARVTGGILSSESDGSTDEAAWFEIEEAGALHRVELVDTALGMTTRKFS